MRSKQYIDADSQYLSIDGKNNTRGLSLRDGRVNIPINADRITFQGAFGPGGEYATGILAMNESNAYIAAQRKTNEPDGERTPIKIGWMGYPSNEWAIYIDENANIGLGTTPHPTDKVAIGGNLQISGNTINGRTIGGNERNDIMCFTSFPSFAALHNLGYIGDEDYSETRGTQYNIYLKALLDYLFDTEPDKRNYFGVGVPGNQTLVMLNKYTAPEKYASGLGINYGMSPSTIISFGYNKDVFYYHILGVYNNNSVSLDDLREVLTTEQISKLESKIAKRVELNNIEVYEK